VDPVADLTGTPDAAYPDITMAGTTTTVTAAPPSRDAKHPVGGRLRSLTAINTLDILEALGWERLRLGRRWIELSLRVPARAFARHVLAFDERVAAEGLPRASEGLLALYAGDLAVNGRDRVPAKGPLLVLANHPGMTDTVALFAAIRRADLMILAADRPFLRALTATSRSLIPIASEPSRRREAVRRAVEHLHSGGALLTFPAGEIEPDPAANPGAVAALERWSESVALFARLVPEARVLPAVVRGVLSRRAQRSPVTLLRRKREDRERLGAMLQILSMTMLPGSLPVHVRVDFLEPFPPGELAGGPGKDAARRIVARIRARVAAFLAPVAR
jgi:hypothetical protein